MFKPFQQSKPFLFGKKLKNQLRWLKRDIGYTFWVFTEQIACLALPRLLLFPLAAYIIGKEGFGIFSTALSVTLILGIQPQNGLGTGLLRYLPDYPDEKRPQFFGTAMRMCHPAMVIIVVVGLIGTVIAGSTKLVPWKVLNCLIPLILSLYPENQFWLILTENRFLRHFRNRAMWFTLRSFSSVIFGIIGALTAGAIGLAWGFMFGNALVYIAIRLKRNHWYQTSYHRDMSIILKSVWLKITIAGILTVSIPHLNRIFLSLFHSFESVADLVAATSIVFIFLAPVQCFGMLVFSMISKYSSIKQVSSRGKTICLILLVFGVIVMPVVLFFTGPLILRILYPKFGEEPFQLLRIVVWMVPAGALISILSPFVMKFASIKTLPIINTITFVATMIPAITLIPAHAAYGASWAIVIGNSISAVIFSFVVFRLFLRQ